MNNSSTVFFTLCSLVILTSRNRTFFCNFRTYWPWPWIRSDGIPPCFTHRPLSTHQILLKLEKLFVDGQISTPSSRPNKKLQNDVMKLFTVQYRYEDRQFKLQFISSTVIAFRRKFRRKFWKTNYKNNVCRKIETAKSSWVPYLPPFNNTSVLRFLKIQISIVIIGYNNSFRLNGQVQHKPRHRRSLHQTVMCLHVKLIRAKLIL